LFEKVVLHATHSTPWLVLHARFLKLTRARNSLARAVYADKDIYLLDDVLSAVDVYANVCLLVSLCTSFSFDFAAFYRFPPFLWKTVELLILLVVSLGLCFVCWLIRGVVLIALPFFEFSILRFR
jgi:hypothetical protein